MKTKYLQELIMLKKIDRWTLCSFDGPLNPIPAGVGNLEFLEKNATIPRNVLQVVDLYSSKVYVYPMRSRKQNLQKATFFYNEVKKKKIKKNKKIG